MQKQRRHCRTRLLGMPNRVEVEVAYSYGGGHLEIFLPTRSQYKITVKSRPQRNHSHQFFPMPKIMHYYPPSDCVIYPWRVRWKLGGLMWVFRVSQSLGDVKYPSLSFRGPKESNPSPNPIIIPNVHDRFSSERLAYSNLPIVQSQSRARIWIKKDAKFTASL